MDDEHDERTALNVRAIIALFGLTDRPEADLAELLNSVHEVWPQTRWYLADALLGKKGVVGLTVTSRQNSKKYRSYRRKMNDVARGRTVKGLMQEGMGYDDAIAHIAQGARVTPKTIEANVTLAGKAERWCADRLANDSRCKDLSAADLEIIYLLGLSIGRDHDRMLDKEPKALLKALRIVEGLHKAAKTPKKERRARGIGQYISDPKSSS